MHPMHTADAAFLVPLISSLNFQDKSWTINSQRYAVVRGVSACILVCLMYGLVAFFVILSLPLFADSMT